MKRQWLISASCFVAFVLLGNFVGQADPPGQTRLELNARIGDARVDRQAEITRLTQRIDELTSRIHRLERHVLGGGQIPILTVREASSDYELALQRKQAIDEATAAGTASELQIASAKLAVDRAEEQLQFAREAYVEREILLESEVAYAQRRLLEESQKQQQIERLVAKGYTSASALELQNIALELAQNEMKRAKTRLSMHQKRAELPVAKQAQEAAEKDDSE